MIVCVCDFLFTHHMAFSLKHLFSSRKKKNPCILIVEDDALLARLLSDTLTKENMDPQIVDSGLKVMEVALRVHPKVIPLDLILPGLDGFAILKHLKADKFMKNIPVAIITNLNEPADAKSVKVLGAEEYFIKANTRLEEIVDYVKSKL